MSGGHSHADSEHAPSRVKKTAANIVASLFLGSAQLVYTVFHSVFRTLRRAL
ncbi:MAG: hypothetical protein ABEJ99_02125 [Candidatus Nanohaloarchaea archaeon]